MYLGINKGLDAIDNQFIGLMNNVLTIRRGEINDLNSNDDAARAAAYNQPALPGFESAKVADPTQ